MIIPKKIPKKTGQQESPDARKKEALRKKQLALATKFKDEVLKQYKQYVKSVVIFGSITRGDFHEKSDIDMLVIIDDTVARFTPEMKESFDEKLHGIAKKLSEQITVQPAWTLTEFWDMARIGHPLLYTIVRDGWALFDTGFFIPIRKLLEMGRIPTTLEAVEKFMEAAPQKISRVENAKLYMVAEDLYYAMLNSSQAVLMFMGENPPSPKHAPLSVKEHLVEKNLLEVEYLNDLQSVIDFRKGVEHKEIKTISGQQLDDLIEKSKKYVNRMEQLLMQLQKKRKETIAVKNYEVMIKAAVAALKKMEKLPPDPKDLPDAIKKELVDTGKVDNYFSDVFKRVVTMRKMVDDDKLNEVPQREIELTREYVRRFVQNLGSFIDEDSPKKKKKK